MSICVCVICEVILLTPLYPSHSHYRKFFVLSSLFHRLGDCLPSVLKHHPPHHRHTRWSMVWYLTIISSPQTCTKQFHLCFQPDFSIYTSTGTQLPLRWWTTTLMDYNWSFSYLLGTVPLAFFLFCFSLSKVFIWRNTQEYKTNKQTNQTKQTKNPGLKICAKHDSKLWPCSYGPRVKADEDTRWQRSPYPPVAQCLSEGTITWYKVMRCLQDPRFSKWDCNPSAYSLSGLRPASRYEFRLHCMLHSSMHDYNCTSKWQVKWISLVCVKTNDPFMFPSGFAPRHI